MPRNTRSQRLGLGIFFLLYNLNEFGLKYIPPVTLLFIAVQTLLFLGVINPPWDYSDVCISGHAILFYQEYRRLFLSAIEHADDFHLYHNMISFMLKGKSLENKFGSQKFFILLVVFIFSTGFAYVGLAFMASHLFEDYGMMHSCAVGFSGVIFALKILTSYYQNELGNNVFGFYVPSKYAVWAELLVIHVLCPNSSFMGHLAGILVGLIYIKGPLKIIVDKINSIVNQITAQNFYGRPPYGHRQSFTGSGTASSHHQNYSAQYNQNYGEAYDSDEIRRRRIQRFT